jgi:hypothetical protein
MRFTIIIYIWVCYNLTKLYLKSRYHQVHIKEEYTWKTSFKMNQVQVLYQWLVIPFSLSYALATFICLMNDVLHPFLDSFIIVCLNEILIFRYVDFSLS